MNFLSKLYFTIYRQEAVRMGRSIHNGHFVFGRLVYIGRSLGTM